MKLVTLLALVTLAAHGGVLASTLPRDEAERTMPLRVAQAPADAPADSRMQRLREADAELRAAETALAQAQKQLELGKEPLPGERTGTAGGTSRLNDNYWARQAENEAAVKKAMARRDRAVAARNAARF